jgi:hypothetical protein
MSKLAVVLVIGVIVFFGSAWFPTTWKAPYPGPFASGQQEITQLAFSAILLFASLFVVLRKDYGPKDKHWAYGTARRMASWRSVSHPPQRVPALMLWTAPALGT